MLRLKDLTRRCRVFLFVIYGLFMLAAYSLMRF
jgi:hypothetical protein